MIVLLFTVTPTSLAASLAAARSNARDETPVALERDPLLD